MAGPATKYYQKLRSGMRQSLKQLERARTECLATVQQYVGSHYAVGGAKKPVPLNVIALAVNIYMRHLISACPQWMVTAKNRQLRARGKKLELALNHLAKEIKLKQSFERLALDAIFGWGIMKCGLGLVRRYEEAHGEFHDEGQPYADPVSLMDWVHEASARTFEQCAYMGHKYRLPYEWLMDNKDFKNKDQLVKKTDLTQTAEGEQSLDSVSRGSDTLPGEYLEYVECWDMWVRNENVILTLPVESEGPPILEQEHWGPEGGPYHQLSFYPVSGQILPLPPLALLRDMHDLVNSLWRKMSKQANRQKTVGSYNPAAAEDAKRITEAADGEMIGVNAGSKIEEHRYGGVDQVNLAFAMHALDRASWIGGNLEALGGLGAQSEVFRLDRLLTENASKLVQNMQDKMQDCVRDVGNHLAWLLWNDPWIEIPLVKRVAGTQLVIPTSFGEKDREGDLFDYELQLDPYSLQYDSPSMKLQKLDAIMKNYILPLAPQLEGQGMTIDVQGLLRRVGRYAHMEEDLEEIVVFRSNEDAQPEQRQGGGEQVARPNEPTENVRINKPGGTRQGRDAAMMQTLLGAGVQESEMAALKTQG